MPPLEVGALFQTQSDGSVDARAELLKLNGALLALFLELLSVLVEAPGSYAETLTRLLGALQNMQHLVNAVRPRQARDALEVELRRAVAEKRGALAALRGEVAAARERLAATVSRLAHAGGDAAESAPATRILAAGDVGMDTT